MVGIYHTAPKWVICKSVRNRDFNGVIARQYKSSSDKTSVLVNANKESKLITF
jgi:hypothetical protein